MFFGSRIGERRKSNATPESDFLGGLLTKNCQKSLKTKELLWLLNLQRGRGG